MLAPKVVDKSLKFLLASMFQVIPVVSQDIYHLSNWPR